MRRKNLVGQKCTDQDGFKTKSEQSFERYWEGEIVNGVPHGSGTYHATSDGATFVGKSKNGKRHEGIFTYNDGDKYIGDWKTNEDGNHTFWNGTRYDKDGNIIKKYFKGIEDDYMEQNSNQSPKTNPTISCE